MGSGIAASPDPHGQHTIMTNLRYCPCCGTQLETGEMAGRSRQYCPDPGCGHVFWNNPLPVVAAVVEHDGHVILAHNVAWPQGMFGLITGFLEAGETPEDGVLREVKEELDLDGAVHELIGVYPFPHKNQIIIAYHVQTGDDAITLNEELDQYKRLPPEQVWYWPSSTGWAMKAWLEARGHCPERVEFPESVRIRLAQGKDPIPGVD
ncbi:MAG: NUDIX domain-containing protein [Salinisphaera sp.]|nr:NUDIX domain-containing protein [Salinisphaera sp.]MDN5938501.1 NUDIX domain-containing protein [Salinisphaera sp.]